MVKIGKMSRAFKGIVSLLLCILILTPLVSCERGEEESVVSQSETSKELIKSERAAAVWSSEYKDEAGGFASADTVYGFDFYKDRSLSNDNAADLDDGDYKYIFFGEDASRVVNISDGYAITLPGTDFTPDYSLSGYRSRYSTEDYTLTVTTENQNPYLQNGQGYEGGWQIYLEEWLTRFIDDIGFLAANGLRRSKQKQETTEMINGYTVLTYNMEFNFPKKYEYPYYDIAIVRKPDEYVQFYLFVMKSKTKDIDRFEDIVKSFVEFEKIGESANPTDPYELIIPDYWSDETKAYFNKLQNQTTVDWGIFVGSMPEDKAANFNQMHERISGETDRLSEAMDYTFDIMPTYMHIGWGDDLTDFPTTMAKDFAGGNGFNGKPVLQYSYQFTTLNNTQLNGYTPMFDIMTGKYDNHFKNLAQAAKEYGKPIILRLNNEMNSDWVSYCGMITLLDPDIFIDTWKRMHDIFIQEGADNIIWMFHPIGRTTPFSNWGEWLCYFPGPEYVQLFGAGNYEMNNHNNPVSFADLNREVYNKSVAYFDKYPWIIGEFACGSGGEVLRTGSGLVQAELGRNQESQAAWVKGMFDVLNNLDLPRNEYASRIKGVVWFSTNDYELYEGDYKILNYLALDKELTLTLDAFKQGFADKQE